LNIGKTDFRIFVEVDYSEDTRSISHELVGITNVVFTAFDIVVEDFLKPLAKGWVLSTHAIPDCLHRTFYKVFTTFANFARLSVMQASHRHFFFLQTAETGRSGQAIRAEAESFLAENLVELITKRERESFEDCVGTLTT
jgi:hypothetical protein